MALLSVFNSSVFAQTNTFPATGNVGIGTLSPAKNLEVIGAIKTDTLIFANGTKMFSAPPPPPLPIPSPWILAYPNTYHLLPGNTGIGTSAPSQKLEVAGTIYSTLGGFKFPDGSIQTTAASAGPVGAVLWTAGTASFSIVNNLATGNTTLAQQSLIASGQNNTIASNAFNAVILAGTGNQIQSDLSFAPIRSIIASGQNNVIKRMGQNSFIASGVNNSIGDQFSVILGGITNTIEEPTILPPASSFNFISGGNNNRIKNDAHHSSIIGGSSNTIQPAVANTVILGGSGISATLSDAVYVPKIVFLDNTIQTTAGVQQNSSATFSAVNINTFTGAGDRQVLVDASGNLKTGAPVVQAIADWSTAGNDLTSSPTSFIGTLSQHDLIFKTDVNNNPSGAERMRITASGKVGIGTAAPTTDPGVLLDVNGGLNNTFGRFGNTAGYTDIGFNGAHGIINSNQDLLINYYSSKNVAIGNIGQANPSNLTVAGRTGIGTPPAPDVKLHVFDTHDPIADGHPATIRLEQFQVQNNTFYHWDFRAQDGLLYIHTNSDIKDQTNAPFVLKNTGLLGLNTDFPGLNYDAPGRLKLDVRGDGRFTSTTSDANFVRVGYNGTNALIDNFGAGKLLINYYSGNQIDMGTGTTKADVVMGKDLFVTGKVGIGILSNNTTDMPAGYSLYVKEGILTERCRVAFKSSADWSDYVFADDYCLLPLTDLETFIKHNKHLPDVPSADEVVKQGLDVAQTDAMLLKKIEELTLYVLQLKKEIDELKQRR